MYSEEFAESFMRSDYIFESLGNFERNHLFSRINDWQNVPSPMSQQPDEFIPTRQSLLSRLKNWDDKASWRDFFNTYWKLIYSIGLKAGMTAEEAQDLVQET